MATVDMTHGKIHFPPRFLPYLEKHRIFELFHECVEMLILNKPKDHVTFLKNIMHYANSKKDRQRIVFMTPSSFDRETFAELLAQCLGIQNVKRMRLDVITRERVTKAVEIENLDLVEEEESCICPEEGEGGEYPGYFPTWGEEPPYFFGGETIGEDYGLGGPDDGKKLVECEGEDQEEGGGPKKEPCICVCPCVKRLNAEKALEAAEAAKKAKEEEVEEEELETETTATSDEVRWIKEKPRVSSSDAKLEGKKFQEKKFESFLRLADVKTKESKTSVVDIDYGILAEDETAGKGWILADFPMTALEAEQLNNLGAIPTHAFRIIIDEEEEANDAEYMTQVTEWKKVYKNIPAVDIYKGERTLAELAKDLCNLVSTMPHRHAPMQLRIVLIGSRGAGTTTQAKKLVQKYGLAHIDFEVVKARALQQDDEISKLYQMQQDTRPDPEVEAYILEKALLTPAARTCGWVLTGYPKNIDQMRMLDLLATPPNRIIFIRLPPKECFVRLYYRKMDPCLGNEYKIPDIEPAGWDTFEAHVDPDVAGRLTTNKRNDRKQIIADIEEYYTERDKMMAYCGKTAFYINGNNTVEAVFQLIEFVLISPSPALPPRDPFAEGYKVEESYERLKKFRLSTGMYFNNMLLNPPEKPPPNAFP